MSDGICLTPECGGPVESRGVCKSCCNQARKLVSGGRATWEVLEARGLVGPPAIRRGSSHPFNRAFERAAEVRAADPKAAPRRRRSKPTDEAQKSPPAEASDAGEAATETPLRRLVQKR